MHLIEIRGERVGDATIDGDFVGHARVAADCEVLDAEHGAWEGVQQLPMLRYEHGQHPREVVPASP